MKSGLYGTTGMTSDFQTDMVLSLLASKIDQFMEIIVKTSRANHAMILDASHL
jgi:hypothetical protein